MLYTMVFEIGAEPGELQVSVQPTFAAEEAAYFTGPIWLWDVGTRTSVARRRVPGHDEVGEPEAHRVGLERNTS